jgi:hypothetical protein
MIPIGNVRAWQKTDNWTQLTHDEQYTLMTLWSIGRSPLIMGGNMPKNDAFTLSLMTNDEVIAVNQNSINNRQLYSNSNHIAWVADVPGSKDKYVALFNASPAPSGGGRRNRGGSGGTNTASAVEMAKASAPGATEPAEISVALADIGLSGSCRVRDLWAQKDLETVSGTISATVNSHGAVLLRVHPGP